MKRFLYILMPFLVAAVTVSFGESTIPHVQKYLGDNYEICQDLEPVYGIPWEVKLAQGAFESGWGRSKGYRYANAVYGIRGKSPYDADYYINGDGVARKYDCREWSHIDHSEYLLAQRPDLYGKCWDCNDASGRARNVCWAKCIADSYLGPRAPQERKDWYARTLVSIMDKYIL